VAPVVMAHYFLLFAKHENNTHKKSNEAKGNAIQEEKPANDQNTSLE